MLMNDAKSPAARGGRFVHYTSAESLTKIIQFRNIWMRNARCINDYMELSHGHSQLVNLFNNEHNKKLYLETFEPYGEGMGATILGRFDSWWQNIHHNTYIYARYPNMTSQRI